MPPPSRSNTARSAILGGLAILLPICFLRLCGKPEAPPKPLPDDYITAKARELGLDPARCIAFVKDEVVEEAYEGVLRGEVGTLWAGAGNGPDRALLCDCLAGREGANWAEAFAAWKLEKQAQGVAPQNAREALAVALLWQQSLLRQKVGAPLPP